MWCKCILNILINQILLLKKKFKRKYCNKYKDWCENMQNIYKKEQKSAKRLDFTFK